MYTVVAVFFISKLWRILISNSTDINRPVILFFSLYKRDSRAIFLYVQNSDDFHIYFSSAVQATRWVIMYVCVSLFSLCCLCYWISVQLTLVLLYSGKYNKECKCYSRRNCYIFVSCRHLICFGIPYLHICRDILFYINISFFSLL